MLIFLLLLFFSFFFTYYQIKQPRNAISVEFIATATSRFRVQRQVQVKEHFKWLYHFFRTVLIGSYVKHVGSCCEISHVVPVIANNLQCFLQIYNRFVIGEFVILFCRLVEHNHTKHSVLFNNTFGIVRHGIFIIFKLKSLCIINELFVSGANWTSDSDTLWMHLFLPWNLDQAFANWVMVVLDDLYKLLSRVLHK